MSSILGLASGWLHVLMVRLGIWESPAIEAAGLTPQQCRVLRVDKNGDVTWTPKPGVPWDAVRRDEEGGFGGRRC